MKGSKTLDDEWYDENCGKCDSEWDCEIADKICVYCLLKKEPGKKDYVKISEYVGETGRCKNFVEK